MRYEKSSPQTHLPDHPLEKWGKFYRYLEIAPDLYAARHVDVYKNGNILRYDRHHWSDDFGMLADMRWSERWTNWWGPATSITPEEFERVWQSAEDAPNHRLQLASEAHEGSPPWLDAPGPRGHH